jgi:hypothetical protein
MFAQVDVPKNVTVKAPSASVSLYNASWQEAFKGKGNVSYYNNGAVNTNITLTIQGY